ncbi:MAG: hypothetical protein V2I32_12870, partial [Desulforhopalus sp.]|nr:hypothetical protein [Desulforhopalus sp.]
FQVASSIGLGLWPENLTREIDPPEIDQSTLVRLISGRFSASIFWYSLGCLKREREEKWLLLLIAVCISLGR